MTPDQNMSTYIVQIVKINVSINYVRNVGKTIVVLQVRYLIKRKKNDKINSKKPDIVSSSASGSILNLDKTAIVSNSVPTKGKRNNNAKRKLTYIDDLKVLDKNEPVYKQNSGKKMLSVSDRTKQNNHKNQHGYSNESTKNKKQQKRKHKEHPPTYNQSDLNNEKTPEKIYSEKTLRNSKCKLNKQFTGSPNNTSKKLLYFINHSDQSIRDSVKKSFVPELKREIYGELYNKVKKDSPKSVVSYETLTKFKDVFEQDNATSVMKTFNISRAKANELKKNEKVIRNSRQSKMGQIMLDSVDDFYSRGDISFPDPGGRGSFMRYGYEQAHAMFENENKQFKISFSKFYTLKPANMKPLSATPMMYCLCLYCANINLKLKALEIPDLNSPYSLYNVLICKKMSENQIFRNSECIFHKCKLCNDWNGVIYNLAEEASLDLQKEIIWNKWDNEVYHTKNDKICKRKVITTKTGTVDKCLKELLELDIMEPNERFTFVQNFFTQHYQHKQFSECKKTLKDNEVVLIQDFSKNLDLTQQDQTKVAHWGTSQVTVHPTVAYVKVPGFEDPKKVVITHLSNIHKHDAGMVHYITQDCIEYITDLFKISLIKVYLWSDGCASQYKGKTSFYYLGRYDLNIERHYFHTEHGKNESDGVTGEISKKVRNAIKSRRYIIQNAESMQDFLIKECSKDYVFKLISEDNLKTIKEDFERVKLSVLSDNCTRTLHNIKPASEIGKFLTRPFSCFCSNCKEDNYEHCQNKEFTNGRFTERRLPLIETDSDNNHDNHHDDTEDDDMDVYLEVNDSLGKEIEIKKQAISFEDVEKAAPRDDDPSRKDTFVIVMARNENETESVRFVAQLLSLDEDQSIWVEYLKAVYASPEIYERYPNREKETYTVDIDDLIMFLPDPAVDRRGSKFYFTGPIFL